VCVSVCVCVCVCVWGGGMCALCAVCMFVHLFAKIVHIFERLFASYLMDCRWSTGLSSAGMISSVMIRVDNLPPRNQRALQPNFHRSKLSGEAT
jgi:hypothetical protein